MGQIRTLEESMKFTAQFADETLKRAEDAGLTLEEVLNLPNMIKTSLSSVAAIQSKIPPP